MAQIWGLLGSMGFVAPMVQARGQHEQSVLISKRQHQEALAHAEGLHREEVDLALLHHMEGFRLNIAHHNTQIKHDNEIAFRESVRDVWGQKNVKTQTLMIVGTLMFGCAFAIIVEGMPPSGTPEPFLIAFSSVLGGSLCGLFMSVWFGMVLQSRMTAYKTANTTYHYPECGHVHKTFTEYYECRCSGYSRSATKWFYVGTILLVATAALLIWLRFTFTYENPLAAWTFVGLCLATGVALLWGALKYPSQIRVPVVDPEVAMQEALAMGIPLHHESSRTPVASPSARRSPPPPLRASPSRAAEGPLSGLGGFVEEVVPNSNSPYPSMFSSLYSPLELSDPEAIGGGGLSRTRPPPITVTEAPTPTSSRHPHHPGPDLIPEIGVEPAFCDGDSNSSTSGVSLSQLDPSLYEPQQKVTQRAPFSPTSTGGVRPGGKYTVAEEDWGRLDERHLRPGSWNSDMPSPMSSQAHSSPSQVLRSPVAPSRLSMAPSPLPVPTWTGVNHLSGSSLMPPSEPYGTPRSPVSSELFGDFSETSSLGA